MGLPEGACSHHVTRDTLVSTATACSAVFILGALRTGEGNARSNQKSHTLNAPSGALPLADEAGNDSASGGTAPYEKVNPLTAF